MQAIRQKRLKTFMQVEASLVRLLMSLVEGGNSDIITRTVHALHRTDIKGVGNGKPLGAPYNIRSLIPLYM